MSDEFDPYYKWFGIPSAEQPATHYRLLGIQRFESDREVIRNAADLRNHYLKTFANGEHPSLSQKLLTEVSAARVCLLNADRKRGYDEELCEAFDFAMPVGDEGQIKENGGSRGFDPYHKWLGIPPTQQPPDHYRLLGLLRFETDSEVIRNAADARMSYIKTFATGQHSSLSQQLLNELSAACVCLLNAQKKAAYDDALLAPVPHRDSERIQRGPSPPQAAGDIVLPKAPPPRPQAEVTTTEAAPPKQEAEEVAPELAQLFRQTQEEQRSSPSRQSPTWRKRPRRRPVIVLVAAVVVMVFVAWAVIHPRPPAPSSPERTSNETEEFPLGKWIDVLKYIDVNKHAVNGEWKRDGTDLVTTPAEHSRIMIPVVVDGSYDLEVQFTRNAGDDWVSVIFPIGQQLCNAFFSGLHGKVSGLETVDGRTGDSDQNPTKRTAETLINGRKYTAAVKVQLLDEEMADVKVFLDDKPQVAWKGKQAALSLMREWDLPRNKLFGLGGYNTNVTFHRIRLQMKSGSAIGQISQHVERSAKTMVLGGAGALSLGRCVVFRDVGSEDTYVVGFRLRQSGWITGIQPIYAGPNGLTLGREHGREGKMLEVKALDGYAVGGIIVKACDAVDGMQVVFMRMNGDSLDPRDAIKSAWIGGRGGFAERMLGGTGARVIGVHGSCGNYSVYGNFVRSLGLIVERREIVRRTIMLQPTQAYGLKFGGEDMVISDLLYGGKGPITLEAVVTAQARDGTVLGNNGSGGLAIGISNGHWYFMVHDIGGYRHAQSDEPAILGEPVHLAGVFDGKEVRLYVNGSRQLNSSFIDGRCKVSESPFLIGAAPDGSEKGKHFFRGTIESVHVYGGALYTQSFAPKRSFTENTDSLLLLRFDVGQGDIVPDSSKSGRHGRIQGAKWTRLAQGTDTPSE